MTRRLRAAFARAAAAALGLAAVVLGSLGLTAPTAEASVPAVVHQAASVGTNHDPISGGGSTWAFNAVDQWRRNVAANYQWSLQYDQSGSTQGRTQFCQGTYDFGVTDIPYGIANSNEADSCPSRAYVYMPIVAGGTAIMYNLVVAGKRVTNLRLSGETFAKIFTGVITKWNDPVIQADNPQIALPAIPIVPVVRSDGSGATAQVTIWMRQMYPQVWDAYCRKVNRPVINGHCGVTSLYPMLPGSTMISRAGDNSVAAYTAQPGNVGSITYVEYSYALNTGFPVAKLLNQAGYYTEPTAGHVAVSLMNAQLDNDKNSPTYLVEDLSKVYTDADPRTYELSSYSYLILPTNASEGNFSLNKGLTLADFGAYLLCEGQQIVDQLGYSALPVNLVQAGQEQIAKIPGGNPRNKTIQQCHNPTFTTSGDTLANKLADDDPQPAACDKQGPVQCGIGTGGDKTTSPPTRNQDATPSGASGDGGGSSGGQGGSGGGGGSGSGGGGSGGQGGSGSGSGSGGQGGGQSGSGGNGAGGEASGANQATDPNAGAPAGYVNQSASVVLASASPQSIPKFVASWMPLIVIGAGVVLIALTLLPTVVRRRKKAVVAPWMAGARR